MNWIDCCFSFLFSFYFFLVNSAQFFAQIYVPTNPKGAERLPPGIVVSETDLYLRRLWGEPSEVGFCCYHFSHYLYQWCLEMEVNLTFFFCDLWSETSEPYHQDLTSQPRYLVTFTVGYSQKANIDAAVKKVIRHLTW